MAADAQSFSVLTTQGEKYDATFLDWNKGKVILENELMISGNH